MLESFRAPTDHFSLRNNRKLTLSTFQVSSVTRKLIITASHLNRFPCAFDYNCKVFRKLVIVDIRIVEGSVVVEGVLPVDVAGGREVEFFSVHEVKVPVGLITCEGCLVVRSGHGPQAEVARDLDQNLSWNSEEDIWKGWKKSNGTKWKKETGEEKQPQRNTPNFGQGLVPLWPISTLASPALANLGQTTQKQKSEKNTGKRTQLGTAQTM